MDFTVTPHISSFLCMISLSDEWLPGFVSKISHFLSRLLLVLAFDHSNRNPDRCKRWNPGLSPLPPQGTSHFSEKENELRDGTEMSGSHVGPECARVELRAKFLCPHGHRLILLSGYEQTLCFKTAR